MKQKEQNEQEFAFIKEKIKDKPINKRRLLIHAGFNLLCAVVFGVVACFVFVLLKPYLEEWLYPKEESTISIPKDDAPQEGEEDGEEEEEEKKEPPPQPESQTVVVQEELEIEDYQKLQDKLYNIGKQANKSVVTVTGVTSGMDWFNTPYENENRAAGVIIGNSGQELLILTEKKVIVDAQEINITFIDGTMASASLKKYDGNTGIAIISVPLEDIPEAVLGQMAVAPLTVDSPHWGILMWSAKARPCLPSEAHWGQIILFCAAQSHLLRMKCLR